MSTHLEAIGCGEKIETIPKKEVFALEWIDLLFKYSFSIFVKFCIGYKFLIKSHNMLGIVRHT